MMGQQPKYLVEYYLAVEGAPSLKSISGAQFCSGRKLMDRQQI